MKVLVSGASGFVGGRVVRELLMRGYQVVAPMRHPIPMGTAEVPMIGDLGPDTDWSAALDGCRIVVHCAARAHVLNDDPLDPLPLFQRVNRDGTLRLAQQARAAGVEQFLFLSTIKVNGEITLPDQPFHPQDPPMPQDAYAIAKAEAESGLRAMADDTMTLTILRPPLVHGPGVKGNLAVLMKAVRRSWPLPLGSLHNLRSMVGVDNLADAIAFLLERRIAGTFLIRDDNISTPGLIRLLAAAMECKAWLLPLPPAFLAWSLRLLGRRGLADRILGSLVVDDSALRALGWVPPHSLQAGLIRMVREDDR